MQALLYIIAIVLIVVAAAWREQRGLALTVAAAFALTAFALPVITAVFR